MFRRILICLPLTLLLLTVAEAQQLKKIPRIGYLSNTDSANESARSDALRLALRELGYKEGQNIATEYRYAEGKVDRYPQLAADLVRLKVDVIVVAGGSDRAIRAANNATKTIPIVMRVPGSILSRQALLKALPVRAATSPELQILAEKWAGSDWSC